VSKKVSTNINIDNELKSKCRDSNINISQAAELGAKMLLSGIDYLVLEKLINQLSINSYESVETDLELQNKIQLTKSLQNELKYLMKEFGELMEDWVNPIVDKNFNDVVCECAIRLDVNWMNLMYLLSQSQTNTGFNINTVNYGEIKEMEITNKDIEKISTEIDELLNKYYTYSAKNSFIDIHYMCSQYSFEELKCFPERYARLQIHAKKLKLPVEKVYAISQRFWNKDEIQDLTRAECLNF